MTLNEITSALSNWKQARNQQGLNVIQNFFNQVNMFNFQPDPTNQPVNGQSEAYVHFYPGIENGNFVFFAISACYDTPQHQNNIQNYVQKCNLGFGQPQPATAVGNINWQEASARMTRWATNKNPWLAANITKIYQAFCMPQNDGTQGTTHNAFFALKDASSIQDMVADLIIEDVKNATIAYFDTIAPIPPYPPSGHLAESNFYLLSLI